MPLLAPLLAILTTASQLSAVLRDGKVGERFDLTVRMTSDSKSFQRDFSAEDATGAVMLSFVRGETNRILRGGMRIRVKGLVSSSNYGHVFADSQSIEIVGAGTPPDPVRATFGQILSGEFDARFVSISGTLRDCFSDEIDPNYLFLILNDGNDTLYASYAKRERDDADFANSRIGRKVTVTGICDPRPSGMRRRIGRIIRICSLGTIAAQNQPSESPFSAPVIDDINSVQASDLFLLGRRKASGRVIATWQGNALLLATRKGTVSRVNLARGASPRPGDSIEVVGFPETDLYRVNFSRAIWRQVAPCADLPPLPPPTNITSAALMTDRQGKVAISASFHGRTVRLRGAVRSLPGTGCDGRFHLESDGFTIPIDVSSNPSSAEGLEIGSIIDVTGVCVMDIENWRPNLVFPHIKEVMIVTRTAADIAIVRHPPWWTPARLTIVIGSLLASLLGILVWNRSLQALAHKRGTALANEELKRLESDLKVCERTRLAVELHDSIAQNLTGVSMEIDTALRGEEPLPAVAAQHMGRALRTIDSCRGELRNCLWDLRSQALEEVNMNKAIRLTLSQTIGKANLVVRFNVPRSRFSDNTAHAILRIIRELSANAVRHGRATEIRIAGRIENDILKFSVRDNGRGFDPDACPGVLDGHFGLQGVRERVASYEGDVQIESDPARGTKVIVSINAPQNDDEVKI